MKEQFRKILLVVVVMTLCFALKACVLLWVEITLAEHCWMTSNHKCSGESVEVIDPVVRWILPTLYFVSDIVPNLLLLWIMSPSIRSDRNSQCIQNGESKRLLGKAVERA